MWTHYQEIYREVRVSCVVVRFVPQANMLMLGNPTPNQGRFVVQATPTDYNVPISGEILASPYAREYSPANPRPFKVVCRPTVRLDVMVGGGTSSAMAIRSGRQWISTDISNMNYPVCQFSMENLPTGADKQTWRVEATAYVQFRGRRG